MSTSHPPGAAASLTRALEEIGDFEVLLVLAHVFSGAKTEQELLATAGSQREQAKELLQRMIEYGFLERRPRMHRSTMAWAYEVTRKGEELREVVTLLERFGERWSGPDAELLPYPRARVAR
ncbi:winged helix-turn-helix transcriptional regulator [Allokutzneria sp. NRRL B-24872]|uniref:winged helix-turn-helix transcriptional regulator n=1 Tax=Allokutzneria sp. NRRL B-24872 TaxID=1137961 RepID=UPI000A3A3038|nr:winged helix-turn-helix transcriptional regulator [Allokutzneria sp. NRRL B-24872]